MKTRISMQILGTGLTLLFMSTVQVASQPASGVAKQSKAAPVPLPNLDAELKSTDPGFWNDLGLLFEKAGSTEKGVQAFTRAIELAGDQSHGSDERVNRIFVNRSRLLRDLGRVQEAQADLRAGLQIPSRAANTPAHLVNLDDFYNGGLKRNWHGDAPTSSFASLPAGVQTLAGTEFDVRGLVQVSLRSGSFPSHVSGISVKQKCRRLHFLHAAIEARTAVDGTTVGRYTVHVAEGQPREIPLRIGEEFGDWFQQRNESGKNFVVAWTGDNSKSRNERSRIRLFKTIWENPQPEVVVEKIDFMATDGRGWPFLVAITAEP